MDNNKGYYEAVTFTGSRWGLYGEKVVDHRCGHHHRSQKTAWMCPDIKNGYCDNVRFIDKDHRDY